MTMTNDVFRVLISNGFLQGVIVSEQTKDGASLDLLGQSEGNAAFTSHGMNSKHGKCFNINAHITSQLKKTDGKGMFETLTIIRH